MEVLKITTEIEHKTYEYIFNWQLSQKFVNLYVVVMSMS